MLDADASHTVIRRLVDTIPSYARMAGLARDGGHVSDGEIARDVNDGRVGIEVALDTGA
jgi:hypothetical protein